MCYAGRLWRVVRFVHASPAFWQRMDQLLAGMVLRPRGRWERMEIPDFRHAFLPRGQTLEKIRED